MLKKGKSISQEDDLTIIREYARFSITPTIPNVIFLLFMVVLYYSNLARLLFWAIVVLTGICSLWSIFFDGVVGYGTVLTNELKKRGFSKKDYLSK